MNVNSRERVLFGIVIRHSLNGAHECDHLESERSYFLKWLSYRVSGNYSSRVSPSATSGARGRFELHRIDLYPSHLKINYRSVMEVKDFYGIRNRTRPVKYVFRAVRVTKTILFHPQQAQTSVINFLTVY
jgi:hypothetical protein